MASDIPGVHRVTIGADKGYDCKEFVDDLRSLTVTPHVAQKVKGSAIDGRTTRHAGYAVSRKKRKRVEEIFGWMKTVAWLRKARYKGVEKIDWLFTLSAAAYNMVRMRNLGVVTSG
jgi:IS5 family transposase